MRDQNLEPQVTRQRSTASSSQAVTIAVPLPSESPGSRGWPQLSGSTELLLIAFLSILIAAVADHLLAATIGFPKPGAGGTYRRIGPREGPQVFVAGSSLLQFALSWTDISRVLGQGMESWGVAGSTPDIWEVFQGLSTNTDLMIIGIDVYDMNEYHLAESRANTVPFSRTILDLRQSGVDWQFSRRLLSQYPLAYLRMAFPTAGNSDAVLVGVREKAGKILGLASTSEEKDRALVLPSVPVLDFGEITTRVSDWPQGKLLRRMSLMRSENRGMHAFNGPKRMAFRRMLEHARQKGRVIVVVLPVTTDYIREFLTSRQTEEFEKVVNEAQQIVPAARIVRLDRIPALKSNEYFADFVHLNSGGREISTQVFEAVLQTSETEDTSKK